LQLADISLAGELITQLGECIQFLAGQEHLGLDPHQGGNKQNEFAAQLNIQFLALVDIIQEVVDNIGDGNIINIQFIPLNKKEQEVKWAFKLG